MVNISPNKYTSVQDYLKAAEFEIKENMFVKGDVSFSVDEIIGYTPNSFHEKAKRKGWLEASNAIDPDLSDWGQRFLTVMQVNFI